MSIDLATKEWVFKDKVAQVKADLKGKVYKFSQDVLPLYRILNWEWYRDNQCEKVPTEMDIMECLYSLIDNLDTIYDIASSGGLEVGYERDEEGQIIEGYIRFILEDNIHY